MRFRISSGRSMDADAEVSPSPNASSAAASRRPSSSSASTVTVSAASAGPVRSDRHAPRFPRRRAEKPGQGCVFGTKQVEAAEALQCPGEPGRARAVEPVAHPYGGRRPREAERLHGRHCGGAVRRPGLRLQSRQNRSRLAGLQQVGGVRRIAFGVGRRRQQPDRAAAPPGLVENAESGRLHCRPVRGRGPTVVDGDHHLALPLQQASRREDRPGGREHQQRRDQEPQQQHPGRRALAAVVVLPQAEEEPDRGKARRDRLRRGDAEQQPDQRQGQQAEQEPGRCKADGAESQHSRSGRSASWPASASSAETGGASLTCRNTVQPSCPALRLKASLCASNRSR